MLKVVLTSFVFIILTEVALHTVLLLGQLVFFVLRLYLELKRHYEFGLVVMVLKCGSDVRGFDPHHRRFFFFCVRYFVF